jgi:hypothetical protein
MEVTKKMSRHPTLEVLKGKCDFYELLLDAKFPSRVMFGSRNGLRVVGIPEGLQSTTSTCGLLADRSRA